MCEDKASPHYNRKPVEKFSESFNIVFGIEKYRQLFEETPESQIIA